MCHPGLPPDVRVAATTGPRQVRTHLDDPRDATTSPGPTEHLVVVEHAQEGRSA